MRFLAVVGNIVEELMRGEGGVGGVFSHLFFSLETTFKSASSKQQRESPIDYWSNYATMKLFEGHSSQYLIDYARTAFPGIAITDSRDFIPPMPIGY